VSETTIELTFWTDNYSLKRLELEKESCEARIRIMKRSTPLDFFENTKINGLKAKIEMLNKEIEQRVIEVILLSNEEFCCG